MHFISLCAPPPVYVLVTSRFSVKNQAAEDVEEPHLGLDGWPLEKAIHHTSMYTRTITVIVFISKK